MTPPSVSVKETHSPLMPCMGCAALERENEECRKEILRLNDDLTLAIKALRDAVVKAKKPYTPTATTETFQP